jgi:hypothetical protein
MTRSKLLIKAVLVAGGLSVAALTGSLPAVAQEYTHPRRVYVRSELWLYSAGVRLCL